MDNVWLDGLTVDSRELGWRGGKGKEAGKRSQGPGESHPVDLCSLAGWEGRGLGSIVPFLSLLWVASVGLLQPLRVSVWHGLVSFWEQTEIWTSRGRGRGRGVSWCLLPKACVSIDGFILFFFSRHSASTFPVASHRNNLACRLHYTIKARRLSRCWKKASLKISYIFKSWALFAPYTQTGTRFTYPFSTSLLLSNNIYLQLSRACTCISKEKKI